MFDNRKRTKIKNTKIQEWRMELAAFSYTVHYRPGKENVVPGAFSRAFCCSTVSASSTLTELHEGLCHPGMTRLLHFVRSKNLPFSTEDVRKVCTSCKICAEVKPRFYGPQEGTLIKATQPMERLSIDFKGPLPTASRNPYILTVVDKYSRFPFAFPCPNMNTTTVIKCLEQVFSLCGMPNYIHSDLGTSFMSKDLKTYLLQKGVATSRTTPYHPIGNGQVERLNGIIWKAIQLALKSRDLPDQHWELVLTDVLHSLRSLLSTSTNVTPHERFFGFPRRSSSGSSLPSWLMTPGPVLLRRFVRANKNEPLVDQVELLDVNPTYANIRHQDGRESTVSVRDLAPYSKRQVNFCVNYILVPGICLANLKGFERLQAPEGLEVLEVLEGVKVLEGVEVLEGAEVLEGGTEVLEGGAEVLEGSAEVLEGSAEFLEGGAEVPTSLLVRYHAGGVLH
ncbi:uncharacterized protein LOC143020468 [Oratosquilla oratoria]|uniref:uncharacterized protein LOC143020468 n=1 Tax=Oratosquilla oratoria TaxID=337810 RepID=UPI003F765B85